MSDLSDEVNVHGTMVARCKKKKWLQKKIRHGVSSVVTKCASTMPTPTPTLPTPTLSTSASVEAETWGVGGSVKMALTLKHVHSLMSKLCSLDDDEHNIG